MIDTVVYYNTAGSVGNNNKPNLDVNNTSLTRACLSQVSRECAVSRVPLKCLSTASCLIHHHLSHIELESKCCRHFATARIVRRLLACVRADLLPPSPRAVLKMPQRTSRHGTIERKWRPKFIFKLIILKLWVWNMRKQHC